MERLSKASEKSKKLEWVWPLRPMPYVAGFLMLAAVVLLNYVAGQSDFYLIISSYAALFILYLSIWHNGLHRELGFFLLLSLVLRFAVLFSLPNLSDDVYRFIWDGHVILKGMNPFEQTPRMLLQALPEDPHLGLALFEKLNSPDYFTVYPPVAQATFVFSTWLFPNSWLGNAICMKFVLLLFEVGNIWLLWRLLPRLGFPRENTLLYALNPLIIVEITGNLHFEGAMIFFLLLALWLMLKRRWLFSAGAMALSIAAKLLPLMFLPFFIGRLGLDRSVRYFGMLAIFLLGLFAPFLYNQVYSGHFTDSLNLYFQTFEFNASVYYLLRWMGFQWQGYNMISVLGPLLAALVFFGILARAILEKGYTWKKLPLQMLFAICLYLALSLTVHPWYVSLPVVLCLFTRYRFPIMWSALIPLTYINYSYPEYQENLNIVAIEYAGVVAFFIWERIIWGSRFAIRDTG